MIIDGRELPEPAGTAGIPADAVEHVPLPTGRPFELAAVALGPTAADDDTAAVDAALADVVARARAWVGDDGRPPLVIPLFGTLTVWGPHRTLVAGPADRLPQLKAAVVEFAALDGELHDIERHLATLLPLVDADAPLAFEFADAALSRRGELAGRFRDAVSLRRRLAVLAPALHVPAPQPPTLAGQLGERLRERTRIVDRAGFATEQADLLERVYTACGERASDFAIARRQAALEWTIVVLLAAEVVLMLVGALTTGTT